jgi:glycosyltransferase involved in cell wall biosynthesis
MTGQLRVAIATAGRFHVLDLARELSALGYSVDFYSYVPKKRALSFGLPSACHRSLLPFALPALALERFAPAVPLSVREWFIYKALNLGVTTRLRACDLFICMSGIYLEAARAAKRRFGAAIWLERGSRHILSQDEILGAIPGVDRPSSLAIARELAGYALADRIVIPSSHVEESFRRDSAAHAKLFKNPYGVDLTMFPCVKRSNSGSELSLLFVGTWSLRKGCDLLISAVARIPRVRLFHVGSISRDLPFPNDDPRFVHIDPVPQPQLQRFYARADAFILASREDGFGVVLGQALASGLPVICTDRTGGADLAHTSALAKYIKVVPSDDLAALVGAISELRGRIATGEYFLPLTDADRETLSWAAYGRRYAEQIAGYSVQAGCASRLRKNSQEATRMRVPV